MSQINLIIEGIRKYRVFNGYFLYRSHVLDFQIAPNHVVLNFKPQKFLLYRV
jgi:hypothetical protein